MKNKKMFWKLMLLALSAMIVVCGLTGCVKQESELGATDVTTAIPTGTPIATVITTEEPSPSPEVTLKPVTMETEYFSLAYPGLYAETVHCRELTDTAETDFEFTVIINENTYTLFKVVIGADDGDIVSMISGPDGISVPVSFYMNMLPSDLPADNASDFYIAQDVVNEVINTLDILKNSI